MLVGKKKVLQSILFLISQKLQKDMKMSYKWTQGIDLYLAKKNVTYARYTVQLCIAFLPFT